MADTQDSVPASFFGVFNKEIVVGVRKNDIQDIDNR
jgi:hypothetical protein